MIDPKNNNNNDIKDALLDDEMQYNEEVRFDNNSSNNNGSDIKQLMRKLLLVVVLCVVVLVIILLISSLVVPKNRSYSDIESIMKEAAIKYYKDNENMLPRKGNSNEVSAQKLAELDYMKDLDKYRSSDGCNGKVVVYNNDGKFVYTPYLDCGSDYTTMELYKKVTSNVVTGGNGLYKIGNEYVFKGDEVNNFVNINGNLWRIVKITSNNQVVLIYNDSIGISSVWDNRFNSEKKYKAGINRFDISRIYSRLNDIFKSNEDSNNYETKVGIFNKETRKYALNYKLCIGSRGKNTTQKDNSLECSNTIDGKIGLLTLSDYANASLDTNCNIVTNKACQNYNYLVNKDLSGWWLMTASNENTSGVYYVNQSGYVDVTDASNSKALRPVVHIGSNVMYKSGKGTLEKPYILK